MSFKGGIRVYGAGKKDGDDGQAVILVAIVMVVFLVLFFIVGIDFAYVYYVRGELQNAASSSALAGAALLTGEHDDNAAVIAQTDAREEAWKYACENRAAGSRVYLISGVGNDCDSPPADLNNSNDPTGDIVVGHWESETFTPATGSTGLAVNAIRIHAVRTEDSPEGPVGLLFGRMIDMSYLPVLRNAIATREPRPTTALALCIQTCNLFREIEVPNAAADGDTVCEPAQGETCFTPSAYSFYFQTSSGPPPNPVPECSTCHTAGFLAAHTGEVGPHGAAWSAFNNEPNTDLGPNSLIAKYIRGELIAPNVCNKFITTNNGIGSVLAVLKDQYNIEQVNGEWEIISPLLTNCPDNGPGNQKDEPYLVDRYAKITINGVESAGSPKRISISNIECIPCPATELLGTRANLVR